MLSSFAKRSNTLNQLVKQSAFSSLASVQQTEQPPPRPDKLFRKIQLEVRSNDSAVIDSYVQFAKLAAENLNIPFKGIDLIGTLKDGKRWRYYVERQICLRSAFVHKKHREQYEWRTYVQIMNFANLTESTADTFLEYVERNLPEGCSMVVHKYEAIKAFDHLKPSTDDKET